MGSMLNPLMPMIRTEFDLSYTRAGFLMSAFAITSGVSQLPAGWMADRLGPRLMIFIGVSGVALAGVLVGLSPAYSALVAFLVLAALAFGGYHPAASPAISEMVPPSQRGQALGFHMYGGSMAFLLTPLMAAQIALIWGWRGSFITLCLPVIVLGILLYILIGRRNVTRDAAGKSVQDIADTSSVTNWRKLVPFIVLSVSISTMIWSITAYLALFAVDWLGASEVTAARLMAITAATGLLVGPLAGHLTDRFGGIPVLSAVGILAVLFIYLLGLVTDIFSFALVMAAFGIVNYTRMPASEFYIVGNAPAHRRSTILGIYFLAGSEMAGLLTPLVGYLIDTQGFYWTFTYASIALAAVTLICLFFLWSKDGKCSIE